MHFIQVSVCYQYPGNNLFLIEYIRTSIFAPLVTVVSAPRNILEHNSCSINVHILAYLHIFRKGREIWRICNLTRQEVLAWKLLETHRPWHYKPYFFYCHHQHTPSYQVNDQTGILFWDNLASFPINNTQICGAFICIAKCILQRILRALQDHLWQKEKFGFS